jgi:tetratricopeptide (TPR) repeat protein
MQTQCFLNKKIFFAALTVFLVLSLVMPSPFWLTGCAKKEKILENKSLRTESGGEVSFRSEALQQDITVKAKDKEGKPLQGMDVQYSLTERYVVIMARDPKGNYLPDIFVGTPDDFKEKQASMSLARNAYADPAIITTTAVGAIIVFSLAPVVAQAAGYIAPIVSSSIVGGLEAISSAMSTAMQPTSIQIKGPPQEIFSQLESKNINSGALKADLPDMEDPIWLKFAIPEFSEVVKQDLAVELVEIIAEAGVSLSTGEEYDIEIWLIPGFNFPIVVKCEPIKGVMSAARSNTKEIFLECALKITETLNDSNAQNDLLGEIAVSYAKCGRFDKAEELTGLIEESKRGMARKAIVLAEVSAISFDKGHERESKELLSQVLKTIKNLEDLCTTSSESRELPLILVLIADKYAQAGQEDNANAILSQAHILSSKIPSEWDYKERILRQIAAKYAEIGHFDYALKIVDKLEASGKDDFTNTVNAYVKAYVYAKIAGKYSEMGKQKKALEMLAQAIKLAETIQYPQYEIIVLPEIAHSYLKAGEQDKALAMLSQTLSLRGVNLSTTVVIHICIMYAKAGKFDQSLQIASYWLEPHLIDEKKYNETLTRIALVYSEAGQLDKALQISDKLLINVRSSFMEEERSTGTVIRKEYIWDDMSKATLLCKISGKYMEFKQRKKALELLAQSLKLITNTDGVNTYRDDMMQKAIVTGELAAQYVKAEQKDKASQIFSQALQTLNGLEYPEDKARALIKLNNIVTENRMKLDDSVMEALYELR